MELLDIAPEILTILEGEESKEAHGTVESDIWSAGCVFFASVTKGKHPFGDNSRNIVANAKESYPSNMKSTQHHHILSITQVIDENKSALGLKVT